MVAERPFLSAATAQSIKRLRQRGFATVRQFWNDAFTIWRLGRPDGWVEGTAVESWQVVATGTGRLKRSTQPDGQQADQVVFVADSYEFEFDRTLVVQPDDLLVVAAPGGARVFHVETVTEKDQDHPHATAVLTERFGDDVPPAVTP